MLTNRHVLVAGGGGSSKTGVANGFEIFEISHDGDRFIAEEVIRHETGPSVVMNCATFSDSKHSYLVAGQENHCQLYNVQTLVVTDTTEDEKNDKHEKSDNQTVRQRRNSHKQQKTDDNKNSKRLKFVIKPSDSVQTDFGGDEPVQRVVRINPSGKLMATGGTDGVVRLWNFPSFKPKHVLKAHSKEIDDMDFSPCEHWLVTIAKDGLAILWDNNSGKELKRLTWNTGDGQRYLYKRCRFGKIENEKKSALFALANPLTRGSKQKGYLQQWSPGEACLNKSVAIEESLSALAVRDDGRFVAVGTMYSGSVSIYIAFSLQRILHVPGAHSMFVTGLEFLPVVDNQTVSSVTEAAVLSISVDNRVCIHSLSHRVAIPAWLAVMIIIVTLFFTFLLCSYLGKHCITNKIKWQSCNTDKRFGW
ncbi:uncharacterized protein CBL_02762 [Carabus blaptoides fortunei]